MLKLVIPGINQNSKQTKDLVFNILVAYQDLSLMQIYTKIKKEYNVSITYQAVRKAAESLIIEGVLIKEQRRYSLNQKWILNLKHFLDKLAQSKAFGKKTTRFQSNNIKDKYAVYKLESLFELDLFWGDVLIYLAKKAANTKHAISTNIVHYTWWLLINLGREAKIYAEFKKLHIDTYFMCYKKAPLNNKAKEIYLQLGHKFKIKPNPAKPSHIAINTVGDAIIQVEYPKQLMKKIELLYKSCNSFEKLPMKEITKLVHQKQEITFTLINNALLAQSIRENFFSEFNK